LGAHHLTIALRLAAVAWGLMCFQEMLLYGRPTPYGGPYAERWWRYFPYAVFYNILAVMLVSALPILGWLFCHKRPVPERVARFVHGVQLGLLMLTVALDHADNEVMRFLGTHLNFGLVNSYYKVDAWGDDMLHIFATDRGGPGLPFLILVVCPLVLWWVGRRIIRTARPWPLLWPWPIAVSTTLLPFVFPLVMYQYLHGNQFIWKRTEPAILTLYDELKGNLSRGHRPARFEDLAQGFQARWFQNSGDSAWSFPDRERPFVRAPLTPAAPVDGKPWNVIYIQLETFRGWNTGFLRPDLADSPTPFLDRLARDTASAYWRRHLSMNMPTVSGVMGGLCSIKPHSTYNITTTFTYTALECLPRVLRRHGYAAESFTGTDPDWDGEKVWLSKWYDQYHYYEESRNADRVVFREAAERIRELGQGSKPFLAVVTSGSNHYPFRSREPQFTKDPEHRPDQAIRNTMRYTDDVLREFVERLQEEPWFQHTLLVIIGDHGYELGEHGIKGQHTGWRESVWVPLVIHGSHPRLPRGEHQEVASLLDVTPTISDLLGIREENPWMGSSLLPHGKRQRTLAQTHWGAIWGERDRFSMVLDPASGQFRLYDAIKDPLQQHDIAKAHPDVVDVLKQQAEDERQLTNYLLEADRVWVEEKATSAPNVAASAR
jgi:arylsulfatase A-like enzyme